MHKSVVAALTAVALIVSTSVAAVRPAELSPTINAAQPYGTGKLTWFFITAYDASLWTDAPQWSMSAPFALSLRYEMSFTTEELVERTIDEMRKVAPATPTADLARYNPVLTRAFPPVKDGDRITALHIPGSAVRFFHNGRPTAEIADAKFADAFFGIWLSPKTSEPKLRAALLKLR